MPLSPKQIPNADHAEPEDAAPQGFRAWSRQLEGPAAVTRSPATLTIDMSHPLVKVGAAVFIGYTLGRILHRHG